MRLMTHQKEKTIQFEIAARRDSRAYVAGTFLVAETDGAPVIGIFTLHDLMRAQATLLE